MAPWGMKWNAIHHDLHLSVLAGVGGVLAVVLATPHPAAHRILHLRSREREDWKRDDAKEEKLAEELFHFQRMPLAHSGGHFTLFTAAVREIALRGGVRTVLEGVGTRRDQRYRGEPPPGGLQHIYVDSLSRGPSHCMLHLK